MPIQLDGKVLLTPKDVRKKFKKYELSEQKLRRLSQMGMVPSIPTGARGEEGKGGPELYLYDEAVLDQLDPSIWTPQRRGVKPAGQEHRYYSVRRRKTRE